jgi:dienelactone hydrolase
MLRKRRRVALLFAVLTGGLALWLIWPYVTSAALLLDLAGSDGWARRLLPVRLEPVAIEDVSVPTRHGDVSARLYRPASGGARRVAVFPGVHAGGVDEPRLAALTQRMAAAGAIVLSVPLPDLRAFRITAASTDVIEDVLLWMSGRPDLSRDGRVGAIGVSFSGGLLVVAAGRPALRDKLTAAVSLGGHADLPRVLRYVCTGRLSDGTARAPHDYGLAVMLRAALPRLVAPEDLDAADRVLLMFLEASSMASIDPAGAVALWNDAAALVPSLAEPARTLLRLVNERDTVALGSRLLPHVDAIGADAALSPERSPPTAARVLAIHGRDDNVIPSEETPRLAAYLAAHGNADVQWLLTPVVSHATLETDVSLPDAWRLVRFWTTVWSALD